MFTLQSENAKLLINREMQYKKKLPKPDSSDIFKMKLGIIMTWISFVLIFPFSDGICQRGQ
jgi:hypothetical protein